MKTYLENFADNLEILKEYEAKIHHFMLLYSYNILECNHIFSLLFYFFLKSLQALNFPANIIPQNHNFFQACLWGEDAHSFTWESHEVCQIKGEPNTFPKCTDTSL